MKKKQYLANINKSAAKKKLPATQLKHVHDVIFSVIEQDHFYFRYFFIIIFLFKITLVSLLSFSYFYKFLSISIFILPGY